MNVTAGYRTPIWMEGDVKKRVNDEAATNTERQGEEKKARHGDGSSNHEPRFGFKFRFWIHFLGFGIAQRIVLPNMEGGCPHCTSQYSSSISGLELEVSTPWPLGWRVLDVDIEHCLTGDGGVDGGAQPLMQRRGRLQSYLDLIVAQRPPRTFQCDAAERPEYATGSRERERVKFELEVAVERDGCKPFSFDEKEGKKEKRREEWVEKEKRRGEACWGEAGEIRIKRQTRIRKRIRNTITKFHECVQKKKQEKGKTKEQRHLPAAKFRLRLRLQHRLDCTVKARASTDAISILEFGIRHKLDAAWLQA
ncbi:hypothetical protein GALMADRAFT_1352349 [Galerina marginata CBS 339.88]|uniref:Uncharacterized protein n=1 Tax=Galerina marginata (strain CBS 339.88) TaxID=685588 RepID=A0A067SFM2_GALM3|nr:hypothetical protein GALMADRAFT_1352349 [Galerina marginata CBS 339.88]